MMVEAHHGERIVPAEINRQIMGVTNAELPRVVNIGMQLPGLMMGIGRMENQQRVTNELLGGFAWVDPNGKINYLDPRKTRYYN
jgi:hypothetical protein